MGTDSVIYIRTDGNSKIATGHLVRCLCIAQALESLGKQVRFLVSDTESETLLQDLATSIFPEYKFSFIVQILETAVYDNMGLEIAELTTLLSVQRSDSCCLPPHASMPLNAEIPSEGKPLILIDSYYVTPAYLEALHPIAKVAYMDDLRTFDYDVDMVINYDVIPVSKTEEYNRAYTNAGTTLLGAQYTPLRSQFRNLNITLRENIENILITTGGSDPYHFTEEIISDLISQGFSIDMRIVVGKLFDDTSVLKELAAQNPFVHLHHNVSDMAALMRRCDFAISAAGTTLYELCALGIPTVSFTMADNQIIMAETFAETGAVPYAGDIRNNKQTTLAGIKNHLFTLLQNYEKRQKQQQNMHGLVDGNGAINIADALCRL